MTAYLCSDTPIITQNLAVLTPPEVAAALATTVTFFKTWAMGQVVLPEGAEIFSVLLPYLVRNRRVLVLASTPIGARRIAQRFCGCELDPQTVPTLDRDALVYQLGFDPSGREDPASREVLIPANPLALTETAAALRHFNPLLVTCDRNLLFAPCDRGVVIVERAHTFSLAERKKLIVHFRHNQLIFLTPRRIRGVTVIFE